MKTVVIATNNKNKVYEFKSLLGENVEYKTLKEIGYNKEIIENGKTFKENSYIKASQVSKDLGVIAIADDSGLSVDALGGKPGIYSARYSKSGKDDDNNKLLIENLKGIKERSAHYTCAITLCFPDGKFIQTEDYCYGRIIDTPKGENGFGYDPYFYVDEFNKTLAEITLEEKNKVSHRAKAIRKLKELIDDDFNIK